MATTKKTAKKTARKSAAKKAVRKTAAKKAATKRPAAKKAATKRPAAKKAVRQNPLYPFAYRGRASALAHLGREAEVKEAVAGLFKLEPDFRISERVPPRLQLYIDGLRKAGLPE